MIEPSRAPRAPERAEFILQLQYDKGPEGLERALFLFQRRRSRGAPPTQADLAGLRIICTCRIRRRGTTRLVEQDFAYRVASVHSATNAETEGHRVGKSLWLEPLSDLAMYVERRALTRAMDGKTVTAIRLLWPDGAEERYVRPVADSISFLRS